ncbi:MAG: hypothetical protein FWF51_04900 [Chitinivibrionia bacterium]|nr:hypothetical protein [Chitinivibrionia bacterium]
MKIYQKSAPILMVIGFLSLAAGVVLSMQVQYGRTAASVLVALGLILYIIGRIGVYFTPKKNTERNNDADEDDDENEDKTINETEKNKIEI